MIAPGFSRPYHASWLTRARHGDTLRDEALHLCAVVMVCPCAACEAYRAVGHGDYIRPDDIPSPPYKPTPTIGRAKLGKPVPVVRDERTKTWGTQSTPD